MFLQTLHSRNLAFNNLSLQSISKVQQSGLLKDKNNTIEIRVTNFKYCCKEGQEYNISNISDNNNQELLNRDRNISSKYNDLNQLGIIAQQLEFFNCANKKQINSDNLSQQVVELSSRNDCIIENICQLSEYRQAYDQLINDQKIVENLKQQNKKQLFELPSIENLKMREYLFLQNQELTFEEMESLPKTSEQKK
ncbi:Hypothetical_protein [Hexamita inflata]|uniref:Hypothetical_protein n=1 Tax=Hexamita inflata TaxID=28002 RepID=A0AA86PGF0_9EUKA|nr:Hypothetical protein HINF_LOCUS26630 [Hexamita inflata]